MARPRLEEEGVGGGGGLFDFLLVLPSWNLLSHLADAFSSSSTYVVRKFDAKVGPVKKLYVLYKDCMDKK